MLFLLFVIFITNVIVIESRLTALHEFDSNTFSSSSASYCSNPTRKDKVIFPDNLAGRAQVSFDMYSGYINVTTAPDYLFYWFFENQDKNVSAPLIIWTNGGPGCSAMEGATTEIGPLTLFDIKEACSSGTCDYSGQFSANPYAWNKHANLLFLDQPRTVGYSFGYGTTVTSSVAAANDFISFYNEWLNEFPEFTGRPLIIAGESYGGHYVPAWANAILDFNAANPSKIINLSGVVIGNGCVNNTVQSTSQFITFQHEQNLIPTNANPTTQAAAEASMINYIGYQPNYYDYRVKSISCPACYGYNYTAWSYFLLEQTVKDILHVCGDAGNPAFAGSAGGCVSLGNFDANDKFDYSGALAKTLEHGIPVTLYYGKTDTACNYVGGYTMAASIVWNGASAFQKTQFSDLIISGADAGQVKTSGGLTFIQVESSGHMTPIDQPAASAYAIDTILSKLK